MSSLIIVLLVCLFVTVLLSLGLARLTSKPQGFCLPVSPALGLQVCSVFWGRLVLG